MRLPLIQVLSGNVEFGMTLLLDENNNTDVHAEYFVLTFFSSAS